MNWCCFVPRNPIVLLIVAAVTILVIGSGSRLVQCRLDQSLVGDECVLTGVTGEINLGDFSEITVENS